jgi:DNA polymerase-3 subunit gamma/tau
VLSAWNAGALEHALSLFLALYRDVRYSLNPRYEVDLAVSRLCTLSSWVSSGEVKKAIDDAKKLLLGTGAGVVSQAPNPAHFQRQVSSPISAAPDVTPASVNENAPSELSLTERFRISLAKQAESQHAPGQQSEAPKTIPLQAELVCKVFKGSIMEEKK